MKGLGDNNSSKVSSRISYCHSKHTPKLYQAYQTNPTPLCASGVSSCPNRVTNTRLLISGPTVLFPVKDKPCNSVTAFSLSAPHCKYAVFKLDGVGYRSITAWAISGPNPGVLINIEPHTFRNVLKLRFVLVKLAL